MISRKVNLDELNGGESGAENDSQFSTYSARYNIKISNYEFPETEMDPRIAYQLIHDEQSLDGNPFLNLASFVHTWMEPEADKLVMENINKNLIDIFEYPQTDKVIHKKLVNMLGRLFHGHHTDFVGTSTVGSSEAIMLGLLAHKWTWKNSGRGNGKPNIVFGTDAHVCWDKFARYFDVEPRKVPIDKKTLSINVKDVEKKIDENTICVGCIMGTTFTGAIDPIEDINDLLVKIKKDKGWDIPIHVDAASGGFILPFTEPYFKWDFRLDRVKSINVSGHKYGLTYAGLGWLIFRDAKDLPKDLIFSVNYLGEFEDTFTLNFSRGTAMVVAQYYNILRFGKDGYTRIMENVLNVARGLAQQLEDLRANDPKKSNRFVILNRGERLPIIAFKQMKHENYKLVDLSHKIREKGWIVPAYNLPANADETEIMRIVVRENFTAEMAELLVNDIEDACNFFDNGGKTVERRHAVPEEKAYPLC